MPRPDGLALVARYLTAADGDQVGGDWYDALVHPSGATTVMIGDVAGHDIAAAAVMGQLRIMLKMLALQEAEPPSQILRSLDVAARDLAIDELATVLVARIEPASEGPDVASKTVHWSNAGHPAPLLVDANGTVEILQGPSYDLMIGVSLDVPRTDSSHRLQPGSTLLLYTDGLIERPGEDLDEGIARLISALRATTTATPRTCSTTCWPRSSATHPTTTSPSSLSALADLQMRG